jgi:hypothetical protein
LICFVFRQTATPKRLLTNFATSGQFCCACFLQMGSEQVTPRVHSSVHKNILGKRPGEYLYRHLVGVLSVPTSMIFATCAERNLSN